MIEAVLFPGQGAQFEGMGREWAESYAVARETFEEADDVLGFSLRDACWSSGDEVHRTDIAQPGIYTTSLAIMRVLEQEGLNLGGVSLCAGLSLGEYSALCFAGCLAFADGLRLVRLRGEAMQRASEQNPSSMASLVGADEDRARALAAVGAEAGICQVANLNAPGQIIVSGELTALDALEAAAKDHGVRRVRRLVVAGGFHSECMRPAADELAAALEEVEIHAARLPVLSNVTAAEVQGADAIRQSLASQVCSPVRWEDSMREALSRGARTFLEPGPGTVLAGIMRKIDAEAVVRPAASPADLDLGAEVPPQA